MFHCADRKKTPGSLWLLRNPNALLVARKDYLGVEWDNVTDAVSRLHKGVTILGHSYKELGAAMPADLFYLFHLQNPGELASFSARHVALEAFRKDPQTYFAQLRGGYNLVLVDRGRLSHVITTKRFRDNYIETTDEDGHADFNPAYKGRFAKSEPIVMDEKMQQEVQALSLLFATIDPADRFSRQFRRRMSEEDTRILYEILGILKAAGSATREDCKYMLSQITIDLQSGTVSLNDDSSPADHPRDEHHLRA